MKNHTKPHQSAPKSAICVKKHIKRRSAVPKACKYGKPYKTPLHALHALHPSLSMSTHTYSVTTYPLINPPTHLYHTFAFIHDTRSLPAPNTTLVRNYKLLLYLLFTTNDSCYILVIGNYSYINY